MNDTIDPWMTKLRTAVQQGFYKTESSEGEQTPIPWAGKTCLDCPFFRADVLSERGTCQVWDARVKKADDTCSYFDAERREDAETIIAARANLTVEEWRTWLAATRVPLD